ncbi:unnamed protein product [Lepeophtheirus salmonis]|uniref:(salmon louse) hypothetical protein n=1 Tax=Lepeophtheirus salmonis TaxID=72036 RepID=A0A7R8CAW5_LEPSM|nr:unnamed protein product [Lepeophtheirus salmonis]CAF2753701.1 unnamed protein product [Lepeophtheirus salmonis]
MASKRANIMSQRTATTQFKVHRTQPELFQEEDEDQILVVGHSVTEGYSRGSSTHQISEGFKSFCSSIHYSCLPSTTGSKSNTDLILSPTCPVHSQKFHQTRARITKQEQPSNIETRGLEEEPAKVEIPIRENLRFYSMTSQVLIQSCLIISTKMSTRTNQEVPKLTKNDDEFDIIEEPADHLTDDEESLADENEPGIFSISQS